MSRKYLESLEQCAVISWARAYMNFYPALKWLHSIPNGGGRGKTEAKIMKGEGVTKGIYDLFLPIARKGYHGFYLEMKHGKNDRSKDQKDFGKYLDSEGYLQRTYWNARDAQDDIAWYLNMEII